MSSLRVQTKTEKNVEFIVKNFIAGGIAGMCSKTTVAPLDRIKILLQAHNNHYKHLGVFSGLREIIRHEHFFALYKGNFAQMVRIFPYAATQFTAYEIYKKYLSNLLGSHSQADTLIAGSCAGVTAVALTYPLDTIRARLAFQVTTCCGMVPYAGFSFYSFEKLKYLCMRYFPTILCNKCDKNTGGLVLTIPGKLLCGGVAGAVAQSFSYPLDVTFNVL